MVALLIEAMGAVAPDFTVMIEEDKVVAPLRVDVQVGLTAPAVVCIR